MPRLPGLTILRLLGQGASGRVYAARRDLDGWRCAVKVVSADSPESLSRLRREVAVLTSLRLPHLIRLHEVIEQPDTCLALILDLVDGGSVDTILRQRGHLQAGEVITILAPVLATLAALHQRGVVHGDVSAGNVLVGFDGRPQLTDLGAARFVGEAHQEVIATAGFVAPELLDGAQASAATDVYGAGALAWLLLTGSPAPHGALRPSLADLVPETPSAFIELIEDCLRGDPARRPGAEEAAERALAAAPARPVDVPVGFDPADHLTRRIRQLADHDEAADPFGVLGGSGHASGAKDTNVGRGETHGNRGARGAIQGRHRAAPPRRPPGRRDRVATGLAATPAGSPSLSAGLPVPALAGAVSARRWAAASPGRGGAGTPSGVLAGVAVACLAVLATLAWTAWGWSSRGVKTGEPLAPGVTRAGVVVTSATQPPRSASASAADEARSRGTDHWSTLAALVSARAEAYERTDPSRLERVYQPGGAGLRQDTARLEALRSQGARYEGVRYVVHPRLRTDRSAGVATGGPSGNVTGTSVLRAQVDTMPYTIVYPDGRRQRRPGVPGVVCDVTLTHTSRGWRIASVTAA